MTGELPGTSETPPCHSSFGNILIACGLNRLHWHPPHFVIPITGIVPSYATVPALVAVGIFMFRNITKIPMDSRADTVAVFMIVILMPLTYSIILGLKSDFLFWTVIKCISGDAKDIHPIMWVVAFLSVCIFG